MQQAAEAAAAIICTFFVPFFLPSVTRNLRATTAAREGKDPMTG